MPQWPRTDLRPYSAGVPCVGPRHRRPAPATHSPMVRSEDKPQGQWGGASCCRRRPLPGGLCSNKQHASARLRLLIGDRLMGDLISTPIREETKFRSNVLHNLFRSKVSPEHAVLVGDFLYWQLTACPSSILEFDFEKQSLAVIQVPVDVFYDDGSFMVIRTDGGGLGFLFVKIFTAQLGERNTNCDGVASWVLGRTIELDMLLSLDSEVRDDIKILGYAEENNMVFLLTAVGIFAVQLKSLQFKKLPEFNSHAPCHPFEIVYTADIGGVHDGDEALHDA